MATMREVLDELIGMHVVDAGDVAQVTGATPRSVRRWIASKATPRREAEGRLLELKAVADLVRSVLRDEPARLWLRSPNADLGWRKPLELITEGEYRRVTASILAIAEGVTAWLRRSITAAAGLEPAAVERSSRCRRNGRVDGLRGLPIHWMGNFALALVSGPPGTRGSRRRLPRRTVSGPTLADATNLLRKARVGRARSAEVAIDSHVDGQ